MPARSPLPNGSEPWYQTSWFTLQEIADMLGLPVDEARSKMLNQGITADVHDRFPFEVIGAALLREGWTPRRLKGFR